MGNRRRMMGLKDRPLTNGVYIEATNGKLFTSDKWTGSLTANSVVVIQNEVRFRIALTQARHLMKIHSSFYSSIDITAIQNSAKAKLDMNSAYNTAKIMDLQSGTGYAAGYCKSFTFPDGKTKGLLPALGWWNVAYKNKSKVNACLAACSATYMSTSEVYWSSTYYGYNVNAYSAWELSWSNGEVDFWNLTNEFYVRPFAEYV